MTSDDLTVTARAVCAAIRAAAPTATETLKWNAPTFALADDFATLSLRRPGVVQLILHTGAKPKPEHPPITVGTLDGRAKVAARNRVVVTLVEGDDVSGLEQLVRDWVAQLA